MTGADDGGAGGEDWPALNSLNSPGGCERGAASDCGDGGGGDSRPVAATGQLVGTPR